MNAAIHWMNAGLPMRSLKIVIFSRNIANISAGDQPLLDLFQELKDKHEKERSPEVGGRVFSEKFIYSRTPNSGHPF